MFLQTKSRRFQWIVATLILVLPWAVLSSSSARVFKYPYAHFLFSLRGGESDSGRPHYRAIQVQIIHRHGDRTPITTLRDEEYWASTLISEAFLTKISHGTRITRNPGQLNTHKANGKGPFGKLTQLGLLQMVEVGTKLREELWTDRDEDYQPDSVTENAVIHRSIWSPSTPLLPLDIRVYSTDFQRTIQSVQGVLVGFFPEGIPDHFEMDIDARHTSWMIPDPQPRRSKEQEVLERELAARPHMLERDDDMRPLAIKCTQALRPLLGEGAFDMAFGVGDETSGQDNENRVLPWSQLAEITKCLQIRNMLPEAISSADQDSLSQYLAWRWFESLRHPRLVYLAMHKLAHTILHSMKHHTKEPRMTIYSAHDSTLIGLLCVFRLEQPTVWPEYGSYLKLELLEVTSQKIDGKKYVVRFYLNGELLRSHWHGTFREEVPLDELAHLVSTEGAFKQKS